MFVGGAITGTKGNNVAASSTNPSETSPLFRVVFREVVRNLADIRTVMYYLDTYIDIIIFIYMYIVSCVLLYIYASAPSSRRNAWPTLPLSSSPSLTTSFSIRASGPDKSYYGPPRVVRVARRNEGMIFCLEKFINFSFINKNCLSVLKKKNLYDSLEYF